LRGDQNFYLRPYEWLEIFNDKSKVWKTVNLNTFGTMTDDDVKKAI
jgi:hypothetical protein